MEIGQQLVMKVEFSGGLETLFDGKKQLEIDVPPQKNIQWLLQELCGRMNGPQDLFVQDGLVRPGVLVLINDTDWELLDEENYVIQGNDTVHFASTLHGG